MMLINFIISSSLSKVKGLFSREPPIFTATKKRVLLFVPELGFNRRRTEGVRPVFANSLMLKSFAS